MASNDLEQSLKKDGTQPIYLIQGDDLWSIEAAIRTIVAAAVPDPNDTMAVTRVDMAEGKKGARDVVGACRAMGLFTSRLAVVVRAAELLDKKADEREEMQRYCAAPVPTTTLILKVAGADSRTNKPLSLDKRTSLFKAIKKNGVVLDFTSLKPWEAEKWLDRRFSELGHRVERGVSARVVELVGAGLLQLHNVSEQLSLYAGLNAQVRMVDVENALAATRTHTVFELIDAVTSGQDKAVLQHLHAMLEHRERPSSILSMIVRHFRHLTGAIDIVSGGGRVDDVQQQLGIHPFAAKKLLEQTQRFPLPLLRRGFEDFMRADLQVKSSRIAPEVLLEQLLLGLTAAARRSTNQRSGGGHSGRFV